MARVARNGGRQGLKVFRLSDVPVEIRLAAAAAVAARESGRLDPLEAVFNRLKLERVAEDPSRAAVEMTDDCQNAVRVVDAKVWDRAMRRGIRL